MSGREALYGADLGAWVRGAADLVSRHASELTALDKEIGDGDHGTNLDRGFRKAVSQLEGVSEPEEVLKKTATALISTVGGASGPLYGTFFLRASTACAGKKELRLPELVEVFEAGLAGLKQRGRAAEGDKTMVDAMSPAVERLRAAAAAASSPSALQAALEAAALAAAEGAEATRPLVARKGRASYLGERSAGHLDPGARSAALLFQALAELPA